MREQLEALSFKVEPIGLGKEEGERRSDKKVSDESDTYLVEVKDKESSQQYKRLVAEAREKGSAFGTAPVIPSNAIAGIIRDAADQLEKTPSGAICPS